MQCPDCKGSGEYVGFNSVESCQTCNGDGEILDINSPALPNVQNVSRQDVFAMMYGAGKPDAIRHLADAGSVEFIDYKSIRPDNPRSNLQVAGDPEGGTYKVEPGNGRMAANDIINAGKYMGWHLDHNLGKAAPSLTESTKNLLEVAEQNARDRMSEIDKAMPTMAIPQTSRKYKHRDAQWPFDKPVSYNEKMIRDIEIDTLVEGNDGNIPDPCAHMCRSVNMHGLVNPIRVNQLGEILDGKKRLAAVLQLISTERWDSEDISVKCEVVIQ